MALNSDEIAQINQSISDALDQRESDNAFGVSLIPYHTHNGTDSPTVDNIANDIPIPPGGTTKFYRADGTWAIPVGGVAVGSATTGQYGSAKYTTTVTLDWNNGNVQYIVLANGAQTFTFANPLDGGRYNLILKQPSSGAAGTVSWPGTVLWPSGNIPGLSTANNKVDIISFVYDATNTKYYGAATLTF